MLGFVFFLASAAAALSPTPTPVPAARFGAAGAMSKASQPPHGRSLAEVARSVKLRFPAAKPKVITNENLKELAAGAELTMAAPVPVSSSPTVGSKEDQEQAEKKAHWQDRYFSAQQELANLEAEEKRLAAEVARLERDFYARDDPYQRDTVIKPAWDDAVAKLRNVQQRIEGARGAPESIANDARRDGALPGWFREAPRPTPIQQGKQ
jgi:hypothetical protein